jgi:hypothetical protein
MMMKQNDITPSARPVLQWLLVLFWTIFALRINQFVPLEDIFIFIRHHLLFNSATLIKSGSCLLPGQCTIRWASELSKLTYKLFAYKLFHIYISRAWHRWSFHYMLVPLLFLML